MQDPMSLAYADEFRNIAQFVGIAVEKNGLTLRFASPAVQGDEEIVSIALGNNGMALQYASDGLKNNMDVVMWAAFRSPRSNRDAIYFASESLKILT